MTNTKSEDRSEIAFFCDDILKMVLKFRVGNDFGDGTVFRKTMKDMISQMEINAQRNGISVQTTENAKFALIALTDEFIITSDWNGREDWIANPLQMELYARFDAGEEFFNKLTLFQQEPKKYMAELGIFYICLGLGFKGKYALDSSEKLDAVIVQSFEKLNSARDIAVPVLAPGAIPGSSGRRQTQKKIPIVYYILGFAFLGILFYLTVTLISINMVENAVEVLSK
ncbi:MAG: DotU family type IV/VI secretion system protein [Calditrichales bacterium]|nr:MAG: DotU family type IV/VI secretion system protein [Calditrichales bacterium]